MAETPKDTSAAKDNTLAVASTVTSAPVADDLPTGIRLLLQHLSSLVQHKLDDTNYIVWRKQMQSVFKATKLIGYVDGTISCPVMDDSEDQADSTSAEVTRWLLIDEHLKSCMFASITQPVVTQILHFETAASIWSALESRYSSLSRSHILQLKMRLCNIQKGTNSMQKYLDEIKGLSDALACCGEVLRDEDLLLYVMRGLPDSYESFCTSIRTQIRTITLHDITSLLIQEELHRQMLHLKTSSAPIQDTSTALFDQFVHKLPLDNTRLRLRGDVKDNSRARDKDNTLAS